MLIDRVWSARSVNGTLVTPATIASMDPGHVRLNRTKAFVDRYRDYTVLIDGKKVGKIGRGQVQKYPVAAGHHTIRVKVDWTGSKTLGFDVAAGEVREFTCRARPMGLAILELLRSIFQRDRWVILEPS